MSLQVKIQKKLADFTLDVQFTLDSAVLGILGASGAGKTMLLRSIAGLENPDRGRITLRDRVLFDSDRGLHVPARERRVGILFQNYALLPHRTVAENIAFGVPHLAAEKQKETVNALVERAHLTGLDRRYPGSLSGGEQQRAALARALAIEPEALLLDEPFSALDTHLRSRLEVQLQQTFAAYERPTLLVTHNIEEAYRLGEKLMVLSKGRVEAFGPKEGVFRNPGSIEVARLTGCKNFSRARRIASDALEALDWGCRLRVSPPEIPPDSAHVGVRAHYIEFPDLTARTATTSPASITENTFPAWVAQFLETPFRVTLYLKLHEAPGDDKDFHVQAEVTQERWHALRDRPFPWRVRFAPENVMALRQ